MLSISRLIRGVELTAKCLTSSINGKRVLQASPAVCLVIPAGTKTVIFVCWKGVKIFLMEITETLAKWIVKTEIHKIPPEVIEKAKKCILDSLGVTIAGAIDDVGILIRDHVRALSGKPECTVLGTSIRTACPMAALANGTMGHALDFDDTSYSYIGHVTVSVLPAAIAVGEMVEASGGDITEAYIIGTEVD